MNKVKLGRLLVGKGSLELDVHSLIQTRMAVFASSGGGKTYALFKILEATSGMLPQVVLDREGEFSPLRKKHDFLLAGPGGDFPASPALASILCKKILEEDASCIVDIFELKPHEKHQFVRIFLETWLDAPKNLWRPRLLLIDEAHDFAPEKGQGDSEASGAMIELAEKGRKRKIALVGATQRTAKISKNFTAELGNKLVGVAYQDGDRERAGKELEFRKEEQIQSLRRLEPGQFYAFGPALGFDIKLAQIDLPDTRPAGTGRGTMKAPAPTQKVKAILEKFKDLPKEAQEEAKTIEEFKKQISDLKHQIAIAKRETVTNLVVKKLPEGELERLRKEYQKQSERLTAEFDRRKIGLIKDALTDMKMGVQGVINDVLKKHSNSTEAPVIKSPAVILTPLPTHIMNTHMNTQSAQLLDEKPLGISEREILAFLYIHPSKSFKKQQIGAMINRKWKGGSFNAYISRLRSKGFVEGSGNVKITVRGQQFVEANNLTTTQDSKVSMENWLNKLGGGVKKIYEVILSDPSRGFTKEQIGEISGLVCTGGSFNAYVSRLCILGLAVRENGTIKLNPEIQNI